MKKILFVCLGNICRSPTAEGVMLKLVHDSGLTKYFYIDSAGTGAWHVGQPPDPRTRRHALSRGYNLEDLRARQLKAQDLEEFDYIIAMDDQNIANIEAMAIDLKTPWRHKLQKLTNYNQKFKYDVVPDPYHEGAEGFELVLDLVEHCCHNLLQELSRDQ
jgi:protein-tyrosine phosphatase